MHEWADFLAALDSKCLTLVPWCETTWSEEMVKLRTGPFGPLVEEAFAKHGAASHGATAQITDQKWHEARHSTAAIFAVACDSSSRNCTEH